jgi:hypothetical protein
MNWPHLLMGVVVISSISVSVQSMISDKKKQKRTIEIVNAPIACERKVAVRPFQNNQAELVASYFEKSDAFALLRPRL